jgi:hypothetical protein
MSQSSKLIDLTSKLVFLAGRGEPPEVLGDVDLARLLVDERR